MSNIEPNINCREKDNSKTIEMAISDSPWGSYFRMFRDKYGIEWMVDIDPRKES